MIMIHAAAYADCFKLFLRQANVRTHGMKKNGSHELYLYQYLLLVEEDETQVSQLMDFPIRLGDTIPGYVAATKLVINVNLLKQVRYCNSSKLFITAKNNNNTQIT